LKEQLVELPFSRNSCYQDGFSMPWYDSPLRNSLGSMSDLSRPFGSKLVLEFLPKHCRCIPLHCSLRYNDDCTYGPGNIVQKALLLGYCHVGASANGRLYQSDTKYSEPCWLWRICYLVRADFGKEYSSEGLKSSYTYCIVSVDCPIIYECFYIHGHGKDDLELCGWCKDILSYGMEI